MRLGLFRLVLVALVPIIGIAAAKPKSSSEVDLQDILGPSVLTVPPNNTLQPLRVREAGAPLGLDSELFLQKGVDGRLSVSLKLRKFSKESVQLTIIEGIAFADSLKQTYLPIPSRHRIESDAQRVEVFLIPTSPSNVFPKDDQKLGVVGLYNDVMGLCFRALDRLLNTTFPANFSALEKINGHWRFRGPAPTRALGQWIRWIELREENGTLVNASVSQKFWRYLVWSVLEGYNAEDFLGWLQATVTENKEYAMVDALELTDGLAFFFRSIKLNADVLGPSSYAFYYNQGVRAFRSSLYSQAEDYFREALRSDGSQLDAHFNLGMTLYRKENYEGAAAAWLVGTGLEGASADMFYHRGVALVRLEAPLKAAKMFREALARNPKHEAAALWLKKTDPNDETKPKKRRRRRRW